MPRPCCQRLITGEPEALLFKPAGVPTAQLEVRVVTLDEVEALRLADLEGLYHEAAAAQMGVSRATFGRIVAEARRKVAEALVGGHALRLKGGNVVIEGAKTMQNEGRGMGGRCRRRRRCEAAGSEVPARGGRGCRQRRQGGLAGRRRQGMPDNTAAENRGEGES